MAEEVIHSFGWVPQPPDDRDIEYVPRRWTLLALPLSHDLDDDSLPAPWEPVFNQGSLGSCGPQSAAGNLVFTQLKRDGTAVVPSRLFHYYNTRALMGTIGQDSGVDNRNMLKALAKWGWCDESLWPYNIGRFREKPPQGCYDAAAQNLTAIKYMAVPQNLATMKACLVETGRPIIFGFAVYTNMTTPQVDASGDIPMPDGNQQGGHDVLIVGYDDATRRFKIKNSWGTQWGKYGYGTIPYDFAINQAMAGDFWTVIEGEPDVPAPPPTPPPVPPDCDTICDRVNNAVAIYNRVRRDLSPEARSAINQAAAICQQLPCDLLTPILGLLCPAFKGSPLLTVCGNLDKLCELATKIPGLIEQLKPILDALLKACPPKV